MSDIVLKSEKGPEKIRKNRKKDFVQLQTR